MADRRRHGALASQMHISPGRCRGGRRRTADRQAGVARGGTEGRTGPDPVEMHQLATRQHRDSAGWAMCRPRRRSAPGWWSTAGQLQGHENGNFTGGRLSDNATARACRFIRTRFSSRPGYRQCAREFRRGDRPGRNDHAYGTALMAIFTPRRSDAARLASTTVKIGMTASTCRSWRWSSS